jgi:preprotein translocase subunit YajC
MNDDTRASATEPIGPIDASLAAPMAASAPEDAPRAAEPAASFQGSTPRKTEAIRAGVIAGTALIVVLGAAVAMGASPSASPSTDGQAGTGPGYGTGAGPGGGFDQLAPGGPDEVAFGWGRGGPGRMDGRGFGQISVTAISGSSISLATADGWTRTIAVTSATTINKGGVAATLSDLEVGDTIRFSQTRNTDGTYTITAIEIVQPRVAGTVTAVGSDTITITLRDGTSQTIRTTGSTTYHVERTDGTRADVKVRSTIVATGEKAADGSLTAGSVWVRLPHVMGTVTATTADTITLSRADGTKVTVHVGSATTIRVAGIDSAKLSDVKTGMAVVVEGTQRADGSIDATEIGAGTMGIGRGHDGLKGMHPDASSAPAPSSGANG